MPLRIPPLRHPGALRTLPPPAPPLQLHTFFHSTPPNRRSSSSSSSNDHDDDDDAAADRRTHYETLNLATTATPSEVKKSFYALSKTHHPDHNPDDPAAPRRFMRITAAYGVLSDARARAKYDRDVLRLHEHHHPTSPTPRGSYSSTTATGPGGSRPATGLSRRRGTFRGPPPSFYRSGGWGAHGDKRSAAHEESTGGSGSGGGGGDSASASGGGGSGSSSGYTSYGAGGMGPGQEPFGRGSAASDMPHFDHDAQAAHTRTQARNDARRARKMAQESAFPAASDFGEIGSFFAILGVLGVAIGLPYLGVRSWNRANASKSKERGKPATG